jgi:hypothetical protein
MGMFSDAKTEGLEQTEDRLGGYAPLTTDAYPMTISVAYAGASSGGAKNVTIIAKDDAGKEYRETVYYTNKKGENFFTTKEAPDKKIPLPGMVVIDHICLAATEKPLADQETEEKIVKIWNSDEKKELPTSVNVITALTGKKVILGVQENLENKSVKQGDAYVATAEERKTNNIVKVFHFPTKLTMSEAQTGVKEAAFHDAWVERNKGKVQDKRTIKDGSAGTAGRPAGGAPADNGGGAVKSLFGS